MNRLLPPRTHDSRRLDHLDGIRGLAAFSVMVGHIRWSSSLATLPPFHNISLWVDFFFVLSGFVIAHAYRSKLAGGLSVGMFMGRRLARLYPLHLVTLLMALAYEVGKWKLMGKVGIDAERAAFEHNNPASFLSNLLLVHSMGLFPDVTWNAPSWSISVEFYTYLLFAVLVVLTRARARVFWVSLAGLQIGSFAVLSLCTHGDFLSVETDYGFFRCVLGFGLGMTIQHFYALAKEAPVPGKPRDGVKALLALVILVLIAGPTYKTPVTLVAPFLFGAFIWVMVRYRGGWMEKLLLSRPCQALGALSYTIYMIHSVFRMAFKNVWQIGRRHEFLQTGWGSVLWNEGLTIVYVAVVLGISCLCYRFIELPAQRWINRVLDRPRARGPEGSGSGLPLPWHSSG